MTKNVAIGKERRESGGFIGAEGVRKHLKEGPPRRRIGLIVEGAPARHGAKIVEPGEKKEIGRQSSLFDTLLKANHNSCAYRFGNVWYSFPITRQEYRHGLRTKRIPQERY